MVRPECRGRRRSGALGGHEDRGTIKLRTAVFWLPAKRYVLGAVRSRSPSRVMREACASEERYGIRRSCNRYV